MTTESERKERMEDRQGEEKLKYERSNKVE
jgi:hypothetical protein